MLIVVVIIGILAAALIPRLQSVQARARDTKRKADLHQIWTALAIYKEDNGNFDALKDYDFWNLTRPITEYREIWWSYNLEPTSPFAYLWNILSRYMTKVPTDADMTEWSPNWQTIRGYWFAAMPRNGSDFEANWQLLRNKVWDSFILFARTESDWSSSNRVQNMQLCPWWNDMTGFSNDPSQRCWALMWGRGKPRTNSSSYSSYICNTVSFSWDTTNNSGTCTANKNSDDLRYIYIN